MSEAGTVYVVDDSREVRESIVELLASRGLSSCTFETATAFLDAYREDGPACLIADVRLPGMSGLDLQRRLAEMGSRLPVIIVSGHADIPMAVRALKAGALDFVEKPFRAQQLLAAVEKALRYDALAQSKQREHAKLRAALARLTGREREVLRRVAAGTYNKVIAAELGVSISTIEAHRKRITQKLGAESLYDLVRAAELEDGGE